MKRLFTIILIFLMGIEAFAQQKQSSLKTKFQKDKESIETLAGCYKVSFDFAETFSPDTAYKYHERYHSWGIEYVFILEETDKKISLQHLLIVDDTTIIKHWREDWIYENDELFSFYKDKEWKKTKLAPEKVKGTWTQKVYNVDDSPDYESYGTWVHVDARDFWESTCDAPLPRREFSKRNDYNVLRRHSHVELTDYGWIFDQDNEKILRANGIDKTLCWEKGIEKFTQGDYSCQPAVDWWEKNKQYWADVRKVWTEIRTQNNSIKIQKKMEDKVLFERLFDMGDNYSKTKTYNSEEATAAIKKTIEMYLISQ